MNFDYVIETIKKIKNDVKNKMNDAELENKYSKFISEYPRIYYLAKFGDIPDDLSTLYNMKEVFDKGYSQQEGTEEEKVHNGNKHVGSMMATKFNITKE